MIELLEHTSSNYGPRTWYNAAQGVTLAVAIDFSTAGEKLTTKAAAKNGIIHVDIQNDVADYYLSSARALFKEMRDSDCNVLNVAGNGIYTLSKNGYDQLEVNGIIHHIIKLVSTYWDIDKIVSGGQTGADIAGLIAAEKLGIPSVGMWPKGYKMRFEDGVDVCHTKEQVQQILQQYL